MWVIADPTKLSRLDPRGNHDRKMYWLGSKLSYHMHRLTIGHENQGYNMDLENNTNTELEK